MFEFQMPQNSSSIIKVIGVGGGGCNAVANMFTQGIKGVDFIICNTDAQVLEKSPVPNKVRLGANVTKGLGAGMNPEVGRQAALESIDELREMIRHNTEMVFITAGMGGGTGTGAAPVIAQLAREMGILTVGIVTIPFKFEGTKRHHLAREGLLQLEKAVDAIVVINNQNLTKILGSKANQKMAFDMADQVLGDAARGIASIINIEGFMNVDFNDVKRILKDSGTALMGVSTHSGEDRALRAAEDVLASPLLDNVNVQGARGILVNITATEESLGMDETQQIMEHIQAATGEDIEVIMGIVYDETMGDKLSVTLVAAGFKHNHETGTIQTLPSPEKKTLFVDEDTTESRQQQVVSHNKESFSLIEPTLPLVDQLESEKLREERQKRMANQEVDYHNQASLEQLRNIPAWMRLGLDLDTPASEQEEKKISRLSIDDVGEKRFRLNDNNTFLFDNVD